MAVIGLGLASRRWPLFPAVLGNYPGDALWAVLVFLLLAVLLRRQTTLRLAASTLVVAFVVEFGQLYHAPWIDAVRGTRLGRLVLGSGFDPVDLAAYTIGVVIVIPLDGWLGRDRHDRGEHRQPSG